jgi:hypothetical protein
MEDRMRQAYERQQPGYGQHQEGEVIIQKGVKTKPTDLPDSAGDYVEFEEIKD